ncbi:hypothetical protein [Jeotgalibacillus sp. JSM ZJ347]|uniref:hypothetical protein n=1 Tax=Jeotgalibacillus sp. JSM ZJ347 TaxID=3342117 RepID=UPI0035A9183F
METFGRGCLYLIIGAAVLLGLAFITQSHIQIPCVIFIPLVALAFYVAKKKTEKKREDEW